MDSLDRNNLVGTTIVLQHQEAMAPLQALQVFKAVLLLVICE